MLYGCNQSIKITRECLFENTSFSFYKIWYNLIDGEIVDLTVEQFLGETPEYELDQERMHDYLLGNKVTKKRYEKLMYNLN